MPKTPLFTPAWIRQPPEDGTYRSIFKWGAPDKFKHPNQRLVNMLKNRLDLTDEDFIHKEDVGDQPVKVDRPVSVSDATRKLFTEISGPENVSWDDYSRLKYGIGKSMQEELQLRKGIDGPVPDIVIHPRTKKEIEQIVSMCGKENIPIYIYGGGSSVNLGFRAERGGICLVMRSHMNRAVTFSEINQTITVEPGISGPDLEDMLNRAPEVFRASQRYTCGHFPQSFEFSTVGGWISALGAGQQSSYYGDMYDLVLSQEIVTPSGTIKTLDFPGTATGPKVNDILKGNEGAFGVLVSVTLKIFRYMPENRKRFAFIFPNWESTVHAAREIAQGQFGMPSVFRISDPEETSVAMKLYGIEDTPLDRVLSLKKMEPESRCLFIGTSDGERDFARNIKKKVRRICRRYHAVYITGLPVRKWEQGRFTDPYLREALNDFGIVIDTLESGVTWENLHRLHKGVLSYIKSRPRTICMAHASHFYPQGTNLYFIFITKMNDLSGYKKYQEGIIEQILKRGGSLSHHHGVGKMMGRWMEAHLGKPQVDVLRMLKRHFDPLNIMNPGGTLGLDIPQENSTDTS